MCSHGLKKNGRMIHTHTFSNPTAEVGPETEQLRSPLPERIPNCLPTA